MGYGQDQDYEATLPHCSNCNAVLDKYEAEQGLCDGCRAADKIEHCPWCGVQLSELTGRCHCGREPIRNETKKD